MKLKNGLLTIAIAQILVAVSMGLVGPFYSLYYSNITQKIEDVGLIIGLYWVLVGILEYPAGMLADKLGKTRVFFIGGVISSIVVVFYPLIADVNLLLAVEALGALGYALQWPAFYSILADATSTENRSKEFAFVGSLENIFYGLSAILAGVIISTFGFSILFAIASFLNLGSSVIVKKGFAGVM